jgi:hypothetical protein
MEASKKMSKMTAKDYYKSLSLDARKAKRDAFIAKSGISYPTFYSKMARGSFSLLEWAVWESLMEGE